MFQRFVATYDTNVRRFELFSVKKSLLGRVRWILKNK